MRRSPVDTLARAGRWTALVGTVLALLTLGAWTLQRESVEALDAWLLLRHLAGPEAAITAVDDPYRGDPELAAERAAELLEDLAEVQRGDRLEEVKREALEIRARALKRLDRSDEALAAADEWIAFYPRDVRSGLLRGEILNQMERTDEGMAELERLFRLAPEAELVAVPWIRALVREGRYLDAVDAVFTSDGRARSNAWMVTWTDGKPRGRVHQAQVTPFLDGDRFRLDFAVTGPVESMTIGFPAGDYMTLVDPEFVIKLKRSPVTLRLAESDVTCRRVQRTGNSFTQLNGAGASTLQIPISEILRASTIDFSLQAQLVRNPSDVALALVDHVAFGDVAAAMLEAGRGADLERLREARRRSLSTRQFRLYWRTDGPFERASSCFAPLGGTHTSERLEFDVTFPVGAEARNVRLVFPDGIDFEFGLEQFEVSAGEALLEVDLQTAKLPSVKDLERAGAVFTVSGRKPSLSFPLPRVEGAVEAIRLRGWVR